MANSRWLKASIEKMRSQGYSELVIFNTLEKICLNRLIFATDENSTDMNIEILYELRDIYDK